MAIWLVMDSFLTENRIEKNKESKNDFLKLEKPKSGFPGKNESITKMWYILVGPTNIIQDSKEDRGCSVESVALLESHFYKYFPELNGTVL